MNIGDMVMLGIAGTGAISTSVFIQRLFSSFGSEREMSLASLAQGKVGESSSFAALNPSGGLGDRLDLMVLNWFGLKAKLEERYVLMGSPVFPTPLQMLHYKEMAAIILPAFMFLMTYSPLALVFMPLGFFLPDVFSSAKIQGRQGEILIHFPTLVDLAALTIESGLDYMSAFDRILKTAYRKTELELEVEKTLNEVQLGYSRREALRRFAVRTGIQEVRSFVGLIIQSDELGTSLVDLLRNFSADMRFRRLSRAEKLAAQASTKML
ncbi:MAG: type II secretion system F family protein, partial [Elusimicrobia bacterium]|nr:type II secretion system F family protein [Elusimicrobiota bacterium]